MRKHTQRSRTSQPSPSGGALAPHASTTQTTFTAPDEGRRGEGPEEPEMLTYQGLSRMTGIRVGTLYAMVCRNEVPHYRLAARIIRFSTKEIAAWMAGRHQPAREPVGE